MSKRTYMCIGWGINKQGEIYSKFAPVIEKEGEYCYLGNKGYEYLNDKIDIGTVCQLERNVSIVG